MAVSAMPRALMMLALLGCFCGVGIVLGAWAKLTDMCRTGDAAFAGSLVSNPDKSMAYDCGITLSLQWFFIFLELFAVIFAFISITTSSISKYFVMFCFTVATTLFCNFAQTTVQSSYVNMGNNDNAYARSITAAAAGAIVLLTFNFIFMMMYGHHEVVEVATAVPIENKA